MNIVPLFIAIPLGTAFILPLLGLNKVTKKLADLLANLALLSLLTLAFLVSGVIIYKVGGWLPPIGICLVLDGLSKLMLIIVNLVGLMATIYSVQYMEKFTAKTKYYTLFMLMIAGMNGVILSGDMFNLFVFLEIAAIASYALVAFGTEHEELEAAFKYQVLGTAASCFILFGIAILYALTGTLNMADMARVISAQGVNLTVLFVGALFLAGFGLKAALVPFHAWLPDAHPSAPAPISAMLSGVLIKAVGVYAIVRILFNIFGLSPLFSTILLVLGTISMIVGAYLAIGQEDFKRLLAYSSISQIGYVILGLGLATPLGILGGLFHLLNHAIFKALLFLNSGAVVYSTGTRELKKMGGLAEKMPVTGTTATIASLSIAGIPPLNGFWSKLIIIVALIQAKHFIYATLAVLVSIITLAYYLKVQRYAFFGKLGEAWKEIKEVPALMCFPMIVLAFLCVAIGLGFPWIIDTLLNPAAEVLENGLAYSQTVLGNVR